MKGNKTILLLLAAGAAYWYYKTYLKNKSTGLPNYNDVIQTTNNASNVPERVPVGERLQPTGYNPSNFGYGSSDFEKIEKSASENRGIYYGEMDFTPYTKGTFDRFTQKYTIRGFKKLGKVPNTI